MKVALQQRPTFKRVYKKLHVNQRDAAHAAIREIAADPTLGEEKKGDLAGVFVHKFDCVKQIPARLSLGRKLTNIAVAGPP